MDSKVSVFLFLVNNLKKYRVNFSGYSDPEIDWDFEPVEKTVVISAG